MQKKWVKRSKELECGHEHMNATISKHAFLTMLTSCIEVYKKEAMGIILGETHRKHYKVTDALTYTSAERGYMGVKVSAKKIHDIDYVINHVTRSNVLGFFHSHPDYPDHLSGLDKEEHLQEQLPLQILVVVKKTIKPHPWSFHHDLSISGSIGRKYFIKMIAYMYEKKKKSICSIKIVCPFLRTMNALETLHNHINKSLNKNNNYNKMKK